MDACATPSHAPAPLPLAARRHPLVAEVERALRRRCGFELNGKLALGVSGGPDSLGLLIACAALRCREAHFVPIAVHVHHHLRSTADEDAQHVAAVCERLGVPWEVKHIAPGELQGNVSANARRLRYEALAAAAATHGASHVAAAHHAEDQLETIIAALCRGAGAEGASGMRWSRHLAKGINLIRPLLAVNKADCMALCEAAQIEWRADPTNDDVSFSRARLRRDVLPVLDQLWPGAARRAAAAGDALDVAADALEEKLSTVFGNAAERTWDRAALAAHAAPLIATGLRRAAINAGESSNDLLHRQLIAAAEAMQDGDRRPREFRIGRGATVYLTARQVRLDV